MDQNNNPSTHSESPKPLEMNWTDAEGQAQPNAQGGRDLFKEFNIDPYKDNPANAQIPNTFDQFDSLDAKPNPFDQFDPPNQPPINPYKGYFDDLKPEGNTSKPNVELDFEHLVPPENRNHQNQASTVDWSKFTPVDEPLSYQEKKDLMIGSGLVVALLLLIYLGFRLWKKIASGHVGFKRLGILISGLWVGIHLIMNTIAELDYSGFEDKPWMEFFGITLVPNALFWGSLWVAKGFHK